MLGGAVRGAQCENTKHILLLFSYENIRLYVDIYKFVTCLNEYTLIINIWVI